MGRSGRKFPFLAPIRSSTSAVLALLATLCDLRSHLAPAACVRSSSSPTPGSRATSSDHDPMAFGRGRVRAVPRADARDPTTASASHPPRAAHLTFCFCWFANRER